MEKKSKTDTNEPPRLLRDSLPSCSVMALMDDTVLPSGSVKASRILPFGDTLEYTTPLLQKVFGNIELNLEKRHDITSRTDWFHEFISREAKQ
jgi:hypothetical protein